MPPQGSEGRCNKKLNRKKRTRMSDVVFADITNANTASGIVVSDFVSLFLIYIIICILIRPESTVNGSLVFFI